MKFLIKSGYSDKKKIQFAMEKRGHQIKIILIEKMLGILFIEWVMTVIEI